MTIPTAPPAPAPARPAAAALSGLLRSALGSPARSDAPNPVAAFLALHPALTAYLGAVAGRIEHVVHLGQELRLARPDLLASSPLESLPLGSGSSTSVSCRLREVRPDPRGTVVTVDSILLTAAGEEIASGVSTVLLGGVDPDTLRPHLDGAGRPAAAPAARPLPGAPVADATIRVSAVFSSLYAGVSGDDNPIHVDAEAARAAGFDGPIAHGMSVVALALEVAADAVLDGDLSRIRSLGVRFSAPVLCDSELAVEVVPAEDPAVLVLRARTAEGPALKAAWIGIAPTLERSGS
ncbi:hypothetical protein GTU73_17780 [Rathayibacter sp. VKM Ac-2804]|uniref:MaoC family dehydratase n=1 Tax=Rathayibacter sp. VKM Ac-2804 TaxID=2609257 RepID=UPI00132EC659|nr:MaoC family dehydratase [Rathayibacter sp. VKM Ac-2804]QHF25660.1 hypothetical protein GTU73_17780 [Rathayibacter sp. VKM Ac-2804]